jgi:hypothetical protein
MSFFGVSPERHDRPPLPQCAAEIVVGEALTTGSSACGRDGGGANGGPVVAGAGDAGAGDTDVGDTDVGDTDACVDGAFAHGFGFAAWAGGFGVTSARQDERGAKTPW